ncbi:MAG: hypothetical protein KBS79_00425 [Lachnospiraceae bacterium]|nr:hypothetical protein [Candidatus Minthocola equi]
MSKTSLFDKTLYKKNITGCWPLWVISSFFFATIAASLFVNRIGGLDTALSYESLIRDITFSNAPLAFIYALICAYYVWKYLFTTKSINFIHSLPISRKSLYITGIVSGLTIMLIPYIVAWAILFWAGVSFGASAEVMLFSMLIMLCEEIIFFAIATFCAMSTGSKVAMPVLYFILNVLVAAMEDLVSQYARAFVYGVSSYTPRFYYASPIVALLSDMDIYSEDVEFQCLTGSKLAYIYAAVGIVILVVTYFIYKNRKSETAESVIALPAFKPIFRYGVAVCSALYFGRAIYSIFSGDFFEALFFGTVRFSFIPSLICVLFAGLVGYYVASMLLEKSFKVFNKKHLPGAVIVAAVCVLFICALKFDVFGAAKRVPEANEVKNVVVYSQSNSVKLESGTDDAYIAQIIGIHQAIVDKGVNPDESVYNYIYEFSMEYTLDSGEIIRRTYPVVNEGHYENGKLIKEFFTAPEIQKRAIFPAEGDVALEHFELWYGGEYYSYNNSIAMEKLQEAILADIDAGAYMLDNQNAGGYELDLSFENKKSGLNQFVWLYINEDMTNTHNFLMERIAGGPEKYDEADLVYAQ